MFAKEVNRQHPGRKKAQNEWSGLAVYDIPARRNILCLSLHSSMQRRENEEDGVLRELRREPIVLKIKEQN